MNLSEIDVIGRVYGVRANNKVTKTQLIRNIQISERNFPCFATAYQQKCDQKTCRWREDCFAEANKIVNQEIYF